MTTTEDGPDTFSDHLGWIGTVSVVIAVVVSIAARDIWHISVEIQILVGLVLAVGLGHLFDRIRSRLAK